MPPFDRALVQAAHAAYGDELRVEVAGVRFDVRYFERDPWLEVTGWLASDPDDRIHKERAWLIFRADPGGRRVLEAELELGHQWVAFRCSADIEEPGLRALARVMLEARRLVDEGLATRVEEQAMAAAVAASATRATVAGLAPRATAAAPSLSVSVSGVRLPLPGAEERTVPFRRLADGHWASAPLIAVRRGRSGRKIYAEAIHVAGPTLPSGLVVGPEHLRELFGLPPTIIGWIGGTDGPRPSFTATADPSLWDRDVMREPAA